VALAEMCIGGRLGAEIDLGAVPQSGCSGALEVLYSESTSRFVVSVALDKKDAFEALFAGQEFACIGVVGGASLVVGVSGSELFCAPVTSLTHAFKAPLDW
jgi:phosphoribosylformylglycinamidine synthase